jgi:hypothetical protein
MSLTTPGKGWAEDGLHRIYPGPTLYFEEKTFLFVSISPFEIVL